MRINVSGQLVDLQRPTPAQLKDADGHGMTVASVLSYALLSGPAAGTTYGPADQVWRYKLALDIGNAAADGDAGLPSEPYVNLTAEQAAALKVDVSRLFGPIVGGQVIPLLDG